MNADSPRCASLEPGSNVKVLRFLHWLKQYLAIVWIDDGRETDSSDWQRPKAHSPRIETLQPGSNVKYEIPQHR
jgi:hypothetical protein